MPWLLEVCFWNVTKWKWKSLSRVQICATPCTSLGQNSPGQNAGVGCLFLFQGIFPTQGSNLEPRSPTLHVDSLPAEPQGKPKNTGVVSLPLLSGSSQPRSSKPRSSWLRNWNRVSYIAGGFFTNWAIRETQITRGIPRNLNTVLVQFKWFKATYIYKFATFSSVQSLSCVSLFAALWTVACQAPLSMGFSEQEY